MIDPRRFGRILSLGLRLRCPRCGYAPIFRGWFTLLAVCGGCGLKFEREQGYFVGAIYLNYAATVLVAVPGYFVLDYLVGLSLVPQLLLWGGFCIVFPLWFFRYSKSLWLSLDYFFDPGTREPF
ncbi:MAG: DUF983 domain-containing protein [Candidatus Rokubacteria bacterium]|nr:DUF983 domain-containing protein [Candidatus Rokubacteria bacterium]